MTKTQMAIEQIKMGYDLVGYLDNEEYVIEDFVSGGYNGYVCDTISEVADGNVPIYNADIWESVADISEYVEQAISEGFADTSHKVDLMKIFQSGYYLYYQELLHNNLEAMAFNIVAEELVNLLDEDVEVDVDFIESEIVDRLKGFDSDSQMSELYDIANDIVEAINEQE